MAFLYEKKKSKKDDHEYIEITGFEGNGEKLVIPDSIEGLPVEAIGNHSFSGREDIVSVEIPESVKTLYGFAFHNCKNLEGSLCSTVLTITTTECAGNVTSLR